MKIAADAGFASMSAIVTYSGLSADGQVLRAMQNSISMTVNTVDSGACDAQKHAFAGTDRAIRSAGRSAAHPAFSV